MDWDDIRYFLVVARAGSVSAAAREIAVNYTTVARRIAAFEDELDTQLFHRSRSGVELTTAGEAVVDRAMKMEELAIEFDRNLFGRSAQLRGRLRLATSDAIAESLIFPHLAEFRRLHPEIDLEVTTSNAFVNLDLRHADVAVRMTQEPPDHLVGHRFASVGMGVYSSRHYAQVHAPLNISTTQVLTWIDDSNKKPEWMKREVPEATLGPRMDSQSGLLRAIDANLGIAALPHFMAARRQGLRCVIDKPFESGKFIWLLHHPDLRKTARVRAFKDFMSRVLMAEAHLIAGDCEAT